MDASMSLEKTPNELLAAGVDRRRITRYACNGHAQITSLPLNGALLGGTIRDLGRGGCCIENIETTSPFDLGASTEILLKVNSWFFRAMAHVKAVRDRKGISLEFMRMSAGGYMMLEELIADLARPRTGVTRQKRDADSPRRPSWNLSLPAQPKQRIAIAGTIVSAESAEDALASSRRAWARHLYPGETSLDIFA
jgi:hypothetical protein